MEKLAYSILLPKRFLLIFINPLNGQAQSGQPLRSLMQTFPLAGRLEYIGLRPWLQASGHADPARASGNGVAVAETRSDGFGGAAASPSGGEDQPACAALRVSINSTGVRCLIGMPGLSSMGPMTTLSVARACSGSTGKAVRPDLPSAPGFPHETGAGCGARWVRG